LFLSSHSVPLRDEQGYCIQCSIGEPGLLLSIISSRRPFDGYTDQKATNAKILTDVFKKGDRYFNTGDLLYRDSEGYYYWSDRIGDTFRWKGENVSTTEVSQTLSDCKTIADVVVYGVEVPNTDGKAGMAAIVKKEEKLDFDEILAETTKHLPPYAKPLFIRIKNDGKIPTTSTHKYMKTELVKEVRKTFLFLRVYSLLFLISHHFISSGVSCS
jgi:acyl-CoA synthetase (AMP-forming)/AMP-acid ligase II